LRPCHELLRLEATLRFDHHFDFGSQADNILRADVMSSPGH
jgi:hypothetical protein